MATYTTRVELHSATYNDYETLHSEMEKEGFSRYITGSNGKTYHLPTAEYNRDCDFTIEQIRGSAARAAERTGKTFSVFVSEAVSQCSQGLDEVQAYRSSAYATR